jgi:predicted permease
MRPPGVRRLFRYISRASADVHADVAEELAFHVDMRASALMKDGLSAAEARRQAIQEFGNLARSTERLARQDRRIEWRRRVERALSEIRQDAAYALRVISRNRRFSLAAVLTLTVAIGGNTAIFSVVNALFLQPLAVREPEQIVRIYAGESTISWPNVEDIGLRNTVFSGVFVQGQTSVSVAADPLPLVVRAGLVSMNYFSVLGAPPLAGRTLQPDDRAAAVVVLSERLWRSRFGSSPAIIGETIDIDGRAREVIGVMPADFRGIAPPALGSQLWIPIDPEGAHRALARDRGATRFEAYGRLAPGVSVGQAVANLRVLGNQLARDYPLDNARFTSMEVFPASGIGLYRGVGKALLPVVMFIGFLTVVAGLILFISCANLAGLLLARAAARRHEIAVRVALGAGRGRVMRQLLTESAVLGVMGGAAGLALAMVLGVGMSRVAADLPFPIDVNITPDGRVLLYTVGVSALCALLFGLSPARRASRTAVVDSLKAPEHDGGARQRFRQTLIVAQVAISALLLFWSGLFARSLSHAGRIDPGFNPEGVLLAVVQLAEPGDADAAGRADTLLVELQQRTRDFPGVEGVGWASVVPLALLGNERFRISRAENTGGEASLWIVASRLSPGWFSTVEIPFVAGRDFTWQDSKGAPAVAIVNETLARRLWGGAAVGRRIAHGDRVAEVVGIVRDTKYWTLGEEPQPEVYLPIRQLPTSWAPTLHVRTADFRGTADRIRAAVRELQPGAPADLKPMRDAVAVALLPARIGALATGSFGLLGALLATLGVYGLISYLAVQRSREMAIRRALGAPTGHLVRVLVGSSMSLSVAGLVLGIALGSLTAPLLGGLLVGVSALDPVATAATTFVVLATAALASVPPARQGAQADPLALMRGL